MYDRPTFPSPALGSIAYATANAFAVGKNPVKESFFGIDDNRVYRFNGFKSHFLTKKLGAIL